MFSYFLRFRFQDAPKMWQETPKMSQKGHKMSHNSFQDEVKMAKMSQTRAQMWARRARMGPRWAKIPPRAHREGWDSHAAPPQKSKENLLFFYVFPFVGISVPRCAQDAPR